MLNTIYTNSDLNKVITSRCAHKSGNDDGTANGNKVLASKKQITWLNIAMKDYAVSVKNLNTLSMYEASMKITAISTGIANGSIKPRAIVAVKDMYYAVMLIDGAVSIKSFIGDKKTAFDKMVAKYNKDDCRYFTEDVNIAKASAKTLKDNLHRQSFLESLSSLTVKELKTLAKEYSIRLGKETRKDAIIIKFEEQLAS